MIAKNLNTFRERLPVLAGFDDRTLASMDMGEWLLPDVEQAGMLAAAADRLNVHLMLYRAGCRAKTGKGLCARIAAADLGETALDDIARLEKAIPGAVAVAYARPVRLHTSIQNFDTLDGDV